MVLISHRGNIDGVNQNFENQPNYIDDAIKAGYDVEVDIWYIGGKLYLGHDTADILTSQRTSEVRRKK
jgi:hypothetical protein